MAKPSAQLGTRLAVPAMLLAGPGVALTLPGMRSASYLASMAWGRGRSSAKGMFPELQLNAGMAAKVVVDEAVRALMVGMARYPSAVNRRRIVREVSEALEVYEDEGWLDDPASFHRTPPPLLRPRIDRRRAAGTDFEHLSFRSRYEPRKGEPARERWLELEANSTAHAWVLRHRDADERGWLICIPGFRMGRPMVDLHGLRAAYHHYELGMNILIPVLPLHGPRTVGTRSGDGFISADALTTIHAEAQAMWDLRRMVSWIRSQGAERIGVYGVSLGGYNTALLASLEDDLACAIAGIPASCFTNLLHLHAPRPLLWVGKKLGIDWDDVRTIMRVVSPLAIQPRVEHSRRYVFGGLADRLVPPHHVHELWEHWGRPRIEWYQGTHLSFRWDRRVDALMNEALEDSGLIAGGRTGARARRGTRKKHRRAKRTRTG